MMWNAERPLWLIIVRADRPALSERLRRTFARAPWVDVILDRRRAERRRDTSLSPVERRLSDRRSAQEDQTRTPTHRLAGQVEGFTVYQAMGLTAARCPECGAGAAVWFEMPRFAEPPARLELDVRHESVQGKQARHFVELRAATPTGRALLASRILTRTVFGPATPG